MILWLRFLDWSGSAWRRYWKIRRITNRWSSDPDWSGNWQNYERSGRSYRRAWLAPISQIWVDYPEPGWEWTCQNCKEYSFIRKSDMPAILAEWRRKVDYMIAKEYTKGFPAKPTAATAPCTNCCFHPGAPE